MGQNKLTDEFATITEERIRFLEDTNRTYISILDILSSDDIQTGLNSESVFSATLWQAKRLLPFREMGILVNIEDSNLAMALSEPRSSEEELHVDVNALIMDGTLSRALYRYQSIMVPATRGEYSILLHVIATKTRINGMFVGRLHRARKPIDTPSLNALTIILGYTAHALENITLQAMFRENIQDLEQSVRAKNMELEVTTRQLKKSNEQLEIVSNTDHLTRIYNRRFLMKELDREMRLARMNMTFFSIIILDIDYFKSVNDSYGHQNGDLVIIAVAELVQNKMRGRDLVARYGGEEFVVLMPETSLNAAVRIAERLRTSVREISFSSPMENLTITISLGVATFLPGIVDDSDSLIRHADKALYRAKNSGRDRVEQMELNKNG